MKQLFAISFASASIAIGTIPALAEVDPKIHKLCIEAKDYAGCVRAMTGKSDEPQKIIQVQSTDGNQCPAGSAYVGGGNCQQVSCEYTTAGAIRALGHDQIIAGKKDSSGKDVWGCPFKLFLGRGRLRLAGAVLRTTNNSSCPQGEPRIGFNSTCQTAEKDWMSPSEEAAIKEKEGPKCNFKLKQYDCSFDRYLEANPSLKKWAELNPEMADKERIKLQSID